MSEAVRVAMLFSCMIGTSRVADNDVMNPKKKVLGAKCTGSRDTEIQHIPFENFKLNHYPQNVIRNLSFSSRSQLSHTTTGELNLTQKVASSTRTLGKSALPSTSLLQRRLLSDQARATIDGVREPLKPPHN